MKHRTWAEVDLDALRENWRIYRKLVSPRDVMAVVKADAYGHGAVPVARALWEEGARSFAVAAPEEGRALREAGIGGEILILGYTAPEDAAELFALDLTQTVVDAAHGEALARTGVRLKCHAAIDTGMRRIGLDAGDPAACEKTVRAMAEKLNVTGLFTHLCTADTDDPDAVAFTRRQIALFEAVAGRLTDLSLTAHCLNSAGGLRHGTALPGPVRLGIVLYGCKPDPSNVLPAGVRPVLSWYSSVAMVKEIFPGDTVGYGRAFRAERPMRLATVTAGYADGVSRLLSDRGSVLIRGKRAPIVGRVCMDQLMADVTKIPDAAPGDTVTLIGRDGTEEIRAEDVAALTGTIGYEVLCDISPRTRRVYRKEKT
ncbi:MAG: alanine racemase [Clostridia bacterium]|nr:alanine racemase [Clostridia bacterium]